MKYVILSEELEVMQVYPFEVPNSIPIPDDVPITQYMSDGFLIMHGTVFTQEDLDQYIQRADEIESRKQKIIDELSGLIGLNVITLTDTQRWKLLGVVLYKLGVINFSGIIQPFEDWIDC